MTHVTHLPTPTKMQEPKSSRSAPQPAHDQFKRILRESPASRHKKEDSKKKAQAEQEALSGYLSGQVGQAALSAASSLALSGTQATAVGGALGAPQLPAEMQALFEKMAGTMILLTSSLDTETSLFLDAPQFSSSPFYGTRITIKEFSTAPKAFNIEIASNPGALQLLQTHQAALLNAFHQGNFNFSVGRIDTLLQNEEAPLFQRKEAIGDDEQERGSQS